MLRNNFFKLIPVSRWHIQQQAPGLPTIRKFHSHNYPCAKPASFTKSADSWRCRILSQLVYRALKWQSLDALKCLLCAGYPMAKYKHGYTPLMIAVDLENFEAVSQLIHAGAALNEQDDVGDTALMKAAHSNNRAILEALLEVSSP
jgi:hypothetical protein